MNRNLEDKKDKKCHLALPIKKIEINESLDTKPYCLRF